MSASALVESPRAAAARAAGVHQGGANYNAGSVGASAGGVQSPPVASATHCYYCFDVLYAHLQSKVRVCLSSAGLPPASRVVDRPLPSNALCPI